MNIAKHETWSKFQRMSGAAVAALWVGVIFSFSLVGNPAGELPPLLVRFLGPAAHALEFFILALLLYGVVRSGLSWRIILLIGLLVAFADEYLIQAMMPTRVGDIWDVAADGLGLMLGVVIAPHAKRIQPLLRLGAVIALLLSVPRFFV